jgi:hypothetical protein
MKVDVLPKGAVSKRTPSSQESQRSFESRIPGSGVAVSLPCSAARCAVKLKNKSTPRPIARRALSRGARANLLAMMHMLQAMLEKQDQMLVQQVKGSPSVPPDMNQTELSETPEMMGNGRLAQADGCRHIPDARLRLGQDGDDPDPARVAEGPEQVSHMGGRMLVEHVAQGASNSFMIEHVFNYALYYEKRIRLSSLSERRLPTARDGTIKGVPA